MSPLKVLRWGLRHKKILVKVYTFSFIIWALFWIMLIIVACTSEEMSKYSLPVLLLSGFVMLLIFIVPPFLPLYYYYYKQSKLKPEVSVETKVKEKVLDPYLSSVKENVFEVESYFKGEKGISWGPVIVHLFDAVMLTLQRLVIDKKGVKPIEELRRERKLYFDSLISILKNEEKILDPEDLKELEILRDLRNRVVHENYRPTRDNAIWAYNLVKRFVSKYYPDVFI
ncbi:MAG: hypothetical protein ACPLZG_13560 [Thermoproteota archaeon]